VDTIEEDLGHPYPPGSADEFRWLTDHFEERISPGCTFIMMATDDAYEILHDKQPTGVVELPSERILDDFPYFGGATNGGMPNPDLIEQVFRSEFDVAYEEGGLFILTMHPHITGHRSRVAGLEKLIVHMKSKPGVWFATHEQIARYVKGNARS
jgi:peptidoglycan/xylan/chitin deacetylase (PgdA/CDA1 family)